MQRYPDEFKARAVDLYNKVGVTYDQLANDLGVSRASSSAWLTKSKTKGLDPIDESEADELKKASQRKRDT